MNFRLHIFTPNFWQRHLTRLKNLLFACFILKSYTQAVFTNNNWRPHEELQSELSNCWRRKIPGKRIAFWFHFLRPRGRPFFFFFMYVYRCLKSCECAIRVFGTDTIPFPGSTYYNFRKTCGCKVMIKCFPKATLDFTFVIH